MRFQNEVAQLPDEPRSALQYRNKGVIVAPGIISASFLEMKRVVMKRLLRCGGYARGWRKKRETKRSGQRGQRW